MTNDPLHVEIAPAAGLTAAPLTLAATGAGRPRGLVGDCPPPFDASEPDTAPMREIAMKIRPLQDHVIVKRAPEDEQTRGGLIIPDTAKEKPLTGTVIAVGSGKLLKDGTVRPPAIRAGDRVMFVKYAGAEVTLDGEEHLMLREDDILGVLEQE